MNQKNPLQEQGNFPQPLINNITSDYYDEIKQTMTYDFKACYVFCFNKTSEILVAANNNDVILFEFSNGQLSELQILKGHSDSVLALYFMKKQNQFISGSDDRSIRIWSQQTNLKWKCEQLIENSHNRTNGYVRCIIMNKNEDLMISCCWSGSINFWVEMNYWIISQEVKFNTHYLFGELHLNDSESELIALGFHQILVLRVNGNKKWNKIQRIQISREFMFFPQQKSFFAFKRIDNRKFLQIRKTSKFLYLGSTGSLQNKVIGNCIIETNNSEKINLKLLDLSDQLEFVLEDSYSEKTQISGIFSEDKQYLITWDYYKYNLQVRRKI